MGNGFSSVKTEEWKVEVCYKKVTKGKIFSLFNDNFENIQKYVFSSANTPDANYAILFTLLDKMSKMGTKITEKNQRILEMTPPAMRFMAKQKMIRCRIKFEGVHPRGYFFAMMQRIQENYLGQLQGRFGAEIGIELFFDAESDDDEQREIISKIRLFTALLNVLPYFESRNAQ